jgi:hypothetical protein
MNFSNSQGACLDPGNDLPVEHGGGLLARIGAVSAFPLR